MQRLFQAAESGNLNLLKNSLKYKGKSDIVNAQKWNLLHFACIGGQTEVVRFLIEKNVNINGKTNDGVTPLHLAAQVGNEFLISILVEAGAAIDVKDIYIL